MVLVDSDNCLIDNTSNWSIDAGTSLSYNVFGYYAYYQNATHTIAYKDGQNITQWNKYVVSMKVKKGTFVNDVNIGMYFYTNGIEKIGHTCTIADNWETYSHTFFAPANDVNGRFGLYIYTNLLGNSILFKDFVVYEFTGDAGALSFVSEYNDTILISSNVTALCKIRSN